MPQELKTEYVSFIIYQLELNNQAECRCLITILETLSWILLHREHFFFLIYIWIFFCSLHRIFIHIYSWILGILLFIRRVATITIASTCDTARYARLFNLCSIRDACRRLGVATGTYAFAYICISLSPIDTLYRNVFLSFFHSLPSLFPRIHSLFSTNTLVL